MWLEGQTRSTEYAASIDFGPSGIRTVNFLLDLWNISVGTAVNFVVRIRLVVSSVNFLSTVTSGVPRNFVRGGGFKQFS